MRLTALTTVAAALALAACTSSGDHDAQELERCDPHNNRYLGVGDCWRTPEEIRVP